MFDRDRVLAAVDLVALAHSELGTPKGHGRSARYRCPNPDHQQTGRTPPVTIHTTTHGNQVWRCHVCHAGGTAIDLIARTRGLDIRDAIAHLAQRAGITEADQPTTPRPRRVLRPHVPEPPRPAHAGFVRYADECAAALWQPEAAEIRDWITRTRGIPANVLRRNRIGADLGTRQGRPYGLGIPEGGALVIPVHQDEQLVYVQLRLLHPPPDRDRWLNPQHRAAPHPRIVVLHPVELRHPHTVIVTEGATDGLSAAAAGYRAAAVLGVGFVHDPGTAHTLSRLHGRLVLAFDPDTAGRSAAARLPQLLAAHGRPSTIVNLDGGDLNDHHLAARDHWPALLDQHVTAASERPPRAVSLAG